MPHHFVFLVTGIVFAFLLLPLISGYLLASKWKCLPPGPRDPFIFFKMPRKNIYKYFAQWSKRYGPLCSVSLVGKRVVIINSVSVANDLFNGRSVAFSVRPFRLTAHLAKYSPGLTFLRPGPRFRLTRQIFYDQLNPRVVKDYYSLQDIQSRRFLIRLLQRGSNPSKEVKRLALSTMLQLCLGYNPESGFDIMMELCDRVAKNAALLLVPGKFWIDSFPQIGKRLPTWLMGRNVSECLNTYMKDLEDLIDRSTPYLRPCQDTMSSNFSSRVLSTMNGNVDDLETVLHYSNVSIYGGASDTTRAAVDTLFVAMVMYPEVQKKAQEEIDRVVGSERLPCHEDRPSLPYIESIVREVLRWNPPVPMTSRELEEDQFYNGYLLPRGSTVIANVWAMTHDPDMFPDPGHFSPERFLSTNGEKLAPDVFRIVFGFGRRRCPGKYFASSSIWITFCTLLATVSISAAVGKDGKKVEPVLDSEEGALTRVIPFDCRVEPRSDKTVALLQETAG